MASWKKVIVSGSNADLAQITSSAGIITAGDLNVSGNSFLGTNPSGRTESTGSLFISGALVLDTNTGGGSNVGGFTFDLGPTSDARDGRIIVTPKHRYGGFQYKVLSDANYSNETVIDLYSANAGRTGFLALYNQNTKNIQLSADAQGAMFNTAMVIGTNQAANAFIQSNDPNAPDNTNPYKLAVAGRLYVGTANGEQAIHNITGSTNITGSLNVDGTLTVTGDTLQEDLQTTGTTKLGNDMSDKTEVTGSLNVTGSSFFQGSGIFSGSEAKVTIDPYATNVIEIQDAGGGTTQKLRFRNAVGSEEIVLHGNDTDNRIFLNGGGSTDVMLRTANSYFGGKLSIGAASYDNDNTLSVTGNAKVTTGITGSYLTDNKLLTAGSVGQIESSAITWDDTTLTVGSSGAGHVYATQVTASEVKISSLAADRIVFVNSTNQLEDSANLQYDDDGGLNVGGKLSLTGDLIVSHNLTVQGTASFQNTEDLDVKDRFIRMASGSTTTGDGGFAVQQTGPLDTEGFGYDSALQRWGVTSSFDASQNALNPAAFMPMTINGTENVPTSNQVANETRYKKAGNMYIDTNASMEEGGVWIYV